MVGDKLLARMMDQIKGEDSLPQLFLNWNVDHTRYVAILYLIMQVFNIFDGGIFLDSGLLFSFVCVTVLCVCYLVMARFALKGKIKEKPLSIAYMAYWILLPFACTFFFVYDMQVNGLPANLLIVYLFLSAVPLFDMPKTILAFSASYAWNIVLFIQYGTGSAYLGYGLLFAICGVVVSIISGRQYSMIIERLRQTSMYDQLTDLLTRHIGIPRAEALAAICRREGGYLAVFMSDIDLFKRYNDEFGHIAGDKALRAVASAVASSFHRSSDVVMRFGGEEFAAFARVEEMSDAQHLADRINQAVEALKIPVSSDCPRPVMTVSVGCYVAPFPPDSSVEAAISEWLKRADENLYSVKHASRAANKVEQGPDA